jgi:hypothetical protein
MEDRRSRPLTCPHRTRLRTERRVMGLRVNRRWGPARIAYRLHLNISTVHRILTRYTTARRYASRTPPPGSGSAAGTVPAGTNTHGRAK